MFKSRCLNEINVTSDRHRRRRHSPPRHYPASCLHCFHRHHYQLCRNHHHHHHDSLSPHHSPNLPVISIINNIKTLKTKTSIYVELTVHSKQQWRSQQPTPGRQLTSNIIHPTISQNKNSKLYY